MNRDMTERIAWFATATEGGGSVTVNYPFIFNAAG